MTRIELVERVAAKTGLSKRESAAVVELFLQCIVEPLQAGDDVEIRGFDSFCCRFREPRRSRHPTTGEAVDMPAKTALYFRAGKGLRERLNPELAEATELAQI